MKAIVYKSSDSEAEGSFIDTNLPAPMASGRDLLIEVKAISVNPVDTKVKKSLNGNDNHKVLGWDAVGVVKDIGSKVTLFKPGDRVWYAGDISRQGSNAELQLVDERIVGHAPQTLSNAEAAALPLTSITAWEMLFERININSNVGNSKPRLMIIGAAGGVGSIMVQLAKTLSNAEIIGTASRKVTKDWLLSLGADHVIDHSKPLIDGLNQLGIDDVTHIVSLTHTQEHYESILECIQPQGKFGLIDDPSFLDATKLKRKSISLHWELMFTRPLYETSDMVKQHEILNEIANMIDRGQLKSTLGENFGRINAQNITKAHELLETDSACGKIVLEGFVD
jgi:zinc-binding alcohol dehydrogenase family protein